MNHKIKVLFPAVTLLTLTSLFQNCAEFSPANSQQFIESKARLQASNLVANTELELKTEDEFVDDVQATVEVNKNNSQTPTVEPVTKKTINSPVTPPMMNTKNSNLTKSPTPTSKIIKTKELFKSKNGDQLFIFQGDLNKLADNVEDLSDLLIQYDTLVLTNLITAFAKNSENHINWTKGAHLESTPMPTIYENGKCVSGGYLDKDDRNAKDLIKLVRAKKPNIKILGYVAGTLDNPEGCWKGTKAAQNYLCPKGICSDFIKRVSSWQSVESSAAMLDGFFIDMFNEFYVNKITLNNQISYLKSLKRKDGSSYRVAINTLATEPTYFYSKITGAMELSTEPLTTAKEMLSKDDIILVEGLVYKAGKLQSNYLRTFNLLAEAYLQKGIKWMGIASELVYINRDVFPTSTCLGIYGTANDNGSAVTSQELGCKDTADFGWLMPPALCKMSNFKYAYDQYKRWAYLGGVGFAYTDGGLGSFTGGMPSCFNN